MASYYVYSGAAGAANGTSWADAYTSLVTALSGKAAGDIFFIAHDHSESSGSAITITSPGTNAAPCFFYCVNRAGSVPPVNADLTTGAAISTTGNANITTTGSGYFHGITLTAGNSTGAPVMTINNAFQRVQIWQDSVFALGSTGIGAFNMGNAGASGADWTELRNCSFTFGNAGSAIARNGTFVWRDTAAPFNGATLPNSLFIDSGIVGWSFITGIDLSQLGSGKVLWTNQFGMGHHVMADCKYDPAVTVLNRTGVTGIMTNRVDLVRCGNSGINYDYRREFYNGTITIETTIVRSGGASDGTTPVSWKIVTTANALFAVPFDSPEIAIWNDTTGSAVTATVEGIWGGGAVPNDDEIWLEVRYLGSSSHPRASFVNDGKLVLGSAAGQASSAETWGGSTTAFKLAATFTPQQAGWVFARVRAAKVSSTFYIDPLVTLS